MLDQHLRLEIDARVQPEIFVTRPGIAIAAAVSTAAIRIDAVAERDVGAIVLGDDRLRIVGQILRGDPLTGDVVIGRIELLEVVLAVNPLEAIGRAQRRAPATDGRSSRIGILLRVTMHGTHLAWKSAAERGVVRIHRNKVCRRFSSWLDCGQRGPGNTNPSASEGPHTNPKRKRGGQDEDPSLARFEVARCCWHVGCQAALRHSEGRAFRSILRNVRSPDAVFVHR